MDTNAEQTPPEAIVIKPEHRDKHGRFLPGVPRAANWDREHAIELASKRRQAHAVGLRAGLRAAAAGEIEADSIGTVASATVYGKAIGDGILANATDRPHDAARAYVMLARGAELMSERGDNAAQNAVTLSVTLAGPVAAAWLERMRGDA